ncbi:MAG TPA: glycosyltransferase [Acidimicrobiales bacterium]|nr:glycosyltransferase [Acidimicrobiales bacterium]
MRIALYHDLGPGGAYNFLIETVSRSRHDYTWFRVNRAADSDGDSDECLLKEVVGTSDYPLRSGTREIPHLMQLERRVAGDIDAQHFDLALVHGCRLFQAPGVLRRVQTPALYFMQEPRRASFERGYHGPAFGHPWHPRRARRFLTDYVLGVRDKASVAAADAVVVNSIFSAEAVQAVYGRSASVCLPGVDPDVYTHETSRRERFVLSVGGLEHAKGHWRVVDALGAVERRNRPDLHVVYGRGSPGAAAQLAQMADDLGVRLHLHSSIPRRELVDLYQRAAATVCAAAGEPFGLTTLESISCGTPVVALRRGGYREVIDEGVTGLLVEPQRGALAAGIEAAVLDGIGPIDRETRDRVVARFSWDECAGRLDHLCDEAAG